MRECLQRPNKALACADEEGTLIPCDGRFYRERPRSRENRDGRRFCSYQCREHQGKDMAKADERKRPEQNIVNENTDLEEHQEEADTDSAGRTTQCPSPQVGKPGWRFRRLGD